MGMPIINFPKSPLEYALVSVFRDNFHLFRGKIPTLELWFCFVTFYFLYCFFIFSVLLLVCCSNVNYFAWFCWSWFHEDIYFDITCVKKCSSNTNKFVSSGVTCAFPGPIATTWWIRIVYVSPCVVFKSGWSWIILSAIPNEVWITSYSNDLISTVNLRIIIFKIACNEIYYL